MSKPQSIMKYLLQVLLMVLMIPSLLVCLPMFFYEILNLRMNSLIIKLKLTFLVNSLNMFYWYSSLKGRLLMPMMFCMVWCLKMCCNAEAATDVSLESMVMESVRTDWDIGTQPQMNWVEMECPLPAMPPKNIIWHRQPETVTTQPVAAPHPSVIMRIKPCSKSELKLIDDVTMLAMQWTQEYMQKPSMAHISPHMQVWGWESEEDYNFTTPQTTVPVDTGPIVLWDKEEREENKAEFRSWEEFDQLSSKNKIKGVESFMARHSKIPKKLVVTATVHSPYNPDYPREYNIHELAAAYTKSIQEADELSYSSDLEMYTTTLPPCAKCVAAYDPDAPTCSKYVDGPGGSAVWIKCPHNQTGKWMFPNIHKPITSILHKPTNQPTHSKHVHFMDDTESSSSKS